MRSFFLLFAVLIFSENCFSQEDSLALVNIFPLEVGYQWKYNYSLVKHALEPPLWVDENGNITIKVLTKDFQANQIVWNFEEVQDLTHRFRDLHNNIDTTYQVFNIINYAIIEELDSSHKLTVNGLSRIFTFDSLYRFRRVDSAGNYILTNYRGGSKSVFTFKKDSGLVSKAHTFFSLLLVIENGSLINFILDVEGGLNSFPKEIGLAQNYPNPFNPSTKISWQSPVSSWQTLKVFDMLGNEVATLVDEYKPAGSYEVEFNASSGIRNPASGIYFYQLKVGNYSSTKKMLLLK